MGAQAARVTAPPRGLERVQTAERVAQYEHAFARWVARLPYAGTEYLMDRKELGVRNFSVGADPIDPAEAAAP